MAEIITLPNPILRQKSKEVGLGEETKKLANQLKDTLIQEKGIKGVGLSAVQIGVPVRIFLTYSKKSRKFLTFINPKIIWSSKILTDGVPESKNKYEGCLSVPGLWAIIRRHKAIKIKYQNEKGSWQVRKFASQTATIIQHEYDHLEGILFIDRALQQGNKIYELTKDENGKEYLRETPLG